MFPWSVLLEPKGDSQGKSAIVFLSCVLTGIKHWILLNKLPQELESQCVWQPHCSALVYLLSFFKKQDAYFTYSFLFKVVAFIPFLHHHLSPLRIRPLHPHVHMFPSDNPHPVLNSGFLVILLPTGPPIACICDDACWSSEVSAALTGCCSGLSMFFTPSGAPSCSYTLSSWLWPFLLFHSSFLMTSKHVPGALVFNDFVNDFGLIFSVIVIFFFSTKNNPLKRGDHKCHHHSLPLLRFLKRNCVLRTPGQFKVPAPTPLVYLTAHFFWATSESHYLVSRTT